MTAATRVLYQVSERAIRECTKNEVDHEAIYRELTATTERVGRSIRGQ